VNLVAIEKGDYAMRMRFFGFTDRRRQSPASGLEIDIEIGSIHTAAHRLGLFNRLRGTQSVWSGTRPNKAIAVVAKDRKRSGSHNTRVDPSTNGDIFFIEAI
jgi:hypothetical protein